MAATIIPEQPERWGNESTNFYYTSSTRMPRVPSRTKIHRCPTSFYTHSGNFHHGTKIINLNPPILEKYGTHAAYKLRATDQIIPKPLATPGIQTPMPSEDPFNLYKSHRQNYQIHAMPPPPTVQRLPTEVLGGDRAVARSFNDSFYTTIYQSDINKHSSEWTYSKVGNSEEGASFDEYSGSTGTLLDNLDVRCKSFLNTQYTPKIAPRQVKASSAPPIHRTQPTAFRAIQSPSESFQRRNVTSTRKYPSKGEMLKIIFDMFPSPHPQEPSKWAAKPSKGITLRAARIPGLRNL